MHIHPRNIGVCLVQGFTKKLQSELQIQYARKMGLSDPLASSGLAPALSSATGGGPVGISSSNTGMGPVSTSSAASNLNALKMSVNSFTRELASSMNISRPEGQGTASPPPAREKVSRVLCGVGMSFTCT